MSLFYNVGFWSNDATTIFFEPAILRPCSLLSKGDFCDLSEFGDLGDLLITGDGVRFKLFFCLRKLTFKGSMISVLCRLSF
jgi:hypothetical protein